MLVFARGQLLLQCRFGHVERQDWPLEGLRKPLQGVQDESYHPGLEDPSVIGQEDSFRPDVWGKHPPSVRNDYVKAISSSDLEVINYMWGNLVERYSEMNLTKPTDRLPAISAVAKQLAGKIQSPSPADEYICGIWRDSIHHICGLEVLARSINFHRPRRSCTLPHLGHGLRTRRQ